MNNLKTLLLILAMSVFIVSCEDDDPTVAEITLDAGTLSGGPFTFTVDGNPDMVSGITLDASTLTGSFQNYVITDAERNILGLPPTLEAVEGVNFDEAGEGSCYIYHLTYEQGLNGLVAGENLDNLFGDFDLSNFITVNRNGLNAGVLGGGPFEFTVNGMADMVSGITLDDNLLNGDNQTYVITDDANTILGLPPTLAAIEGVNFDEAGAGVCLIWHLTYADGLTGLEAGNNVSDLVGGYALSNSIMVTRNALNGGTLSGGPYEFVVDGTPDKATDLALDDTAVNGGNSGFVITDADLKILGLPPTLEAAQGVDFDSAGAGVCLIWHITYEDGLVGLEVGMNAGDLDGFFALSNSITVTREPLDAGTLSGGPFTFTIDGSPDMVSNITLDSSNLNGSNQTYVITDDVLNILGLPPTLAAVKGVDFDGAGVGVCYIWHLTYENGIVGLEAGENLDNLFGDFDLSNFITVTRE
ncbi:hypothetical protein [Maribacter aestuarii]|uniref:hypothetical protein n=1 Tax=Maribacter aestuarii TaxID=1130723 RepID=UPI00248BDEB4|nr:hypothetical protein [Maribacter aestuarii]